MVGDSGVEPESREAHDFESCVSTNSTNPPPTFKIYNSTTIIF